jgi:formyl-CoA transferase
LPGFPIRLSETQVPVTAAPLLGQHSDQVYAELLGYTPEQLAALREQKAI